MRPGAAALVGDARITVDTLQQVVERGLEDPQAEQQLGQDRSAFQRQVLSRLVNREVLRAAAAREDVTVSDGDVDDQLQDFAAQAGGEEALEAQAAQNGISPEDLQPFLRDVVLEQALGDAGEGREGGGYGDAQGLPPSRRYRGRGNDAVTEAIGSRKPGSAGRADSCERRSLLCSPLFSWPIPRIRADGRVAAWIFCSSSGWSDF